MSLLVDRSRERDRNDKRVRSAQEAKPKDTYYREDYGWIMSNADVAREKNIKQQFDDNTKSVKSQVAASQSKANSAISSGRGQINSAYDEAISTIKKDNSPAMTEVRVMNGTKIEAVYKVPKTYADEYTKTEGLNTAWINGGLNVDVRAQGGKIVGEELHSSLTDATKQVQNNHKLLSQAVSNTNAQRALEIENFNKANGKAMEGQQALYTQSIASAEGAYGQRVATGKKTYEDSKARYNDSVMGVDGGLLESPTNKVKVN